MTEPDKRFRKEGVRFLKFCVVGAFGAVVDFGSFNLLNKILGFWSIPSSMLSFAFAVISNFIWNRYWTYPDSRSKPISKQAMQFGSLNIVGLLIRTPIFAFSEEPLIRFIENLFVELPARGIAIPGFIETFGSVSLGRNLALAIAVIVVLLWNFGANRLLTYSDVS